jgi:hypothetical protein
VEQERTTLDHRSWKVTRYATLDEVVLDTGAIRYHVQVQDEGRAPFLTSWFNEEDRARDFMNKVMSNAKEVFRVGGG